MKINQFITSANENDNYVYCWPLVAQVTKKLFRCETTMAFITERGEEDSLVTFFRKFGKVVLFKPIAGIASGNQAKVSRLYVSTLYHDSVCVINDVDILPLQKDFLVNSLAPVSNDKLIAIGANAFVDTVDNGKFPMIYTSGKGSTFLNLVNPERKGYEDLLKSWIGLKDFDTMEDISNEAKRFSDESLLRSLIGRWEQKSNVEHLDRNFVGYRAVERIDRAKWNIDESKLKSGWYIDAHLPRPLNKHTDKLKSITDYFGVQTYIKDIEKIKTL